MMKFSYTKVISVAVLIVFHFSSKLAAQDLEETLSNLSADAAESYVGPITNGFGSNLNSGWFAYPPDAVKLGFTLRGRIVGNGTLFSSDDENFRSIGMFRFTEDQAVLILNENGITQGDPRFGPAKDQLLSKEYSVSFSGPTIIGSEDEYLQIRFEGDEQLGLQPVDYPIEEVYGYLDGLSLFPSANVQLTFGTVMGTNFVIRWFPSIDIQDLGKFSFYGFGLVHNTNVWFDNPLPVDLSIGGFYQSLEVGDVFESSAAQFGLYASKEIGGLIGITPYAGVTYETSETSVAYNYNYSIPGGTQTARIEFDLDGENDIGFTVGASLRLVIINLNVDYKAAKTETITAGISFGIL